MSSPILQAIWVTEAEAIMIKALLRHATLRPWEPIPPELAVEIREWSVREAPGWKEYFEHADG